MSRYRNVWTIEDEKILLNWVNSNIHPSGQVIWGSLKNGIAGHSLGSCTTHWNRSVKKKCVYSRHKWHLKQETLFDRATPQQKTDNARKTPQIKRVKVSKSFLWGAIKIERYE